MQKLLSLKNLAIYLTIEEKIKAGSFSESVELILKSNGKVIVAGVGKSANIANKIVATLNSTGQPSVFLHAGDFSFTWRFRDYSRK